MVREVVLAIVAWTLCMQGLPAVALAEDEPPPEAQARARRQRIQAQRAADELPEAEMGRLLTRQEALKDVAQFRELLKREWLLANLNDASFDAALDEIGAFSAMA